jgi:predicted  nucleic acid-binding Zn ribbon protein
MNDKNAKVAKVCPEGKVLNPKTGRCIKKENLIKMNDKNAKVAKVCPEGKVLNPKTGRCIKIK